jgi:hypothetical protein
MVRNRSWPAVSQICSLTTSPSTVKDLIGTDILEPEVDPDSCQVAFLEGVVGESAQQGGLPHRTVADYDHFEEVLVLPNHISNRIIITPRPKIS